MIKQDQTLLITGGAGFIGSNFIIYMLNKYPDYHIINIDKLTYAGSLSNVAEVETRDNYTFIQGDITEVDLIKSIFASYNITGVINFAAESHVDRSIADGTSFVTTNVLGTFNLLQVAKEAWERLGLLKEGRFHHISTDEIYGSLGSEGMFSEDTPYDPRNPYSATKAGANMIVKSFGYTYGMNIVISSCSNNYGPKQHEEKLIPTVIKNALRGQHIPIYGDGQHVRDWIYVEDHCTALDTIFHHGELMNTYNVGGRTEKTTVEMATALCETLEEQLPDFQHPSGITQFKDLITFTEDRLGHDRRYAVNDQKIRDTLGWKPKTGFKKGLNNTVEWYVNKWLKTIH